MEISINNNVDHKLEQINAISEELIRDDYHAGKCPVAMWILGLDDGMK